MNFVKAIFLFNIVSVMLFAECCLPKDINKTKAQKVEDIVKEALYIANNFSQERAVTEFDKLDENSSDGDMYIFAIDGKGVIIAHSTKRLIGFNGINFRDAAGNYVVKKIVDSAQDAKGKGAWISYVWRNPVNQKISKKYSYVIMSNKGYVIGSGFYEDEE